MISFIKGLYFDLDCRVQKVLTQLKQNTFHPDIQKSFVPKTIEYLEELDSLLQEKMNNGELDIDFLTPNNLTEFNQYYEDFRNYEYFRISVILRYDEDSDGYLNNVIRRIYDEIRHLSNPPLLTTISNSHDYYWVESYNEIIAVPYGEENNLLNLPDLYHEIGHLIFRQYAGIVEQKFLPLLDKYIKEQINLSIDERSDHVYTPLFTKLKEYWVDCWIEEFSCDLIATYLCGPAFAWGNMKMSAISNGNKAIYTAYPSHPSDESRMRIVFLMLNKINCAYECLEIMNSWEEFLNYTNNPKHPDYHFFFPDHLLEELTDIVFNYCKSIDLSVYQEQIQKHNVPISKTVNNAWSELHSNPLNFENIQIRMIQEIKESFKE